MVLVIAIMLLHLPHKTRETPPLHNFPVPTEVNLTYQAWYDNISLEESERRAHKKLNRYYQNNGEAVPFGNAMDHLTHHFPYQRLTAIVLLGPPKSHLKALKPTYACCNCQFSQFF